MPGPMPDFLATPDCCVIWGTCRTCIPYSIRTIWSPLYERPLRFKERLLIFRKGIEAVSLKGEASDLLELAGHRKLLTKQCGLPLDQLLLDLGDRLSVDWAELAHRLHEGTYAHAECLARAQAKVLEPV